MIPRFLRLLAALPAISAAAPEEPAPQTPFTPAIRSEAVSFEVQTVARNLKTPWALAFLPGGEAIVSERAAGRLSMLDPQSGQVTPLAGSPEDVFVQANAGMLDVVLHPEFADNRWVYFSYTAGTEDLNTTVVERARLQGRQLIERERLFAAQPWYHNSIVYGCRLAFRDGYLFLTMGDRWDLRHLAQSPGSHLGKIMRLHDDGRVPADNPFAHWPGAAAAVWSLGNRNPQGLAVHPSTGQLWAHEHGPKGGDELNIIGAGKNYGWPVVSYGTEYDGEAIGDGITHKEGMTQPVHFWVPSIAPSDMVFYTGDAFPAWQGNLFIGALAKMHLNRLVIDGKEVVHEERLLADRNWRVRMVEQGPDGFLYIGVDDGTLYRLVPGKHPE